MRVQPIEMQRFTRSEDEQGLTAGWRLEVGWFTRASGLEWAWFGREVVDDDETHEVP